MRLLLEKIRVNFRFKIVKIREKQEKRKDDYV